MDVKGVEGLTTVFASVLNLASWLRVEKPMTVLVKRRLRINSIRQAQETEKKP